MSRFEEVSQWLFSTTWEQPISWKSKKQETVSLSSAEAEYRSLRKVVGELTWIHRLLTELTVSISSPISVHCDSQSAIHIARNPVFHERTKHIVVDCHFVRNKLQEGLISLHHVTNLLISLPQGTHWRQTFSYLAQVGCEIITSNLRRSIDNHN